MTKNIGPFRKFDRAWFTRNQRPLLWLLNGPTKILARMVMRIRTCDVPLRQPICRITPNSMSYGLRSVGDQWQLTTDFRMHPKWSRRIYYSLKPLWWLAHAFDLGVANPFRPDWNLGFDALTVYPNPDPESTSVDGSVYKSDLSWTTARSATSGSAQSNWNNVHFQCDYNPSDSKYYFDRAIFLFDTSSLTSVAVISAAVCSFYSQASGNVAESTYPADICLVSSNPASNTNIVGADYNITNWGSTLYAPAYSITTFRNSAGYHDLTLNASGLAAISKTAITKFGVRGQNDINDTAPSNRSYAFYRPADYTGTSQDPKLVVTYTLPGQPTRKRFGGIPFAALNRGVW